VDTTSFPTTYGNPALAAEIHGDRPVRDATVVTRTREAGALHTGKANLHEVAFGVTGENPHTGTPENPRAAGHMPGGSSSGSAAAVAGGAVSASLGTDTGGSVRIPASCCGVVGIKTTRGAVPTTGVLPLSWLQDTVGPIAATVEDAALLLATVAGADGEDPIAREVPDGWQVRSSDGDGAEAIWRAAAGGWEGAVAAHDAQRITILRPTELWERRVHPDVRDACGAAVDRLADAGARIEAVDLPAYHAARRAQGILLSVHALAVHERWFDRRPDLYGGDIRERLDHARTIAAVDLVRALRERRRWNAWIDEHLPRGTVVVTPTLAFPPPLVGDTHVTWPDGEEDVTPALTRLTSVWNLAGVPAISVPSGTTGEGLPVGLQIIGRWWSEPVLIRTAATVEQDAG
jgi:aspartyl-tRNA(Asn)/glutamyl-tRNA(Gln) amidotransferase subunit A